MADSSMSPRSTIWSALHEFVGEERAAAALPGQRGQRLHHRPCAREAAKVRLEAPDRHEEPGLHGVALGHLRQCAPLGARLLGGRAHEARRQPLADVLVHRLDGLGLRPIALHHHLQRGQPVERSLDGGRRNAALERDLPYAGQPGRKRRPLRLLAAQRDARQQSHRAHQRRRRERTRSEIRPHMVIVASRSSPAARCRLLQRGSAPGTAASAHGHFVA
jgi:hypothetical protein